MDEKRLREIEVRVMAIIWPPVWREVKGIVEEDTPALCAAVRAAWEKAEEYAAAMIAYGNQVANTQDFLAWLCSVTDAQNGERQLVNASDLLSGIHIRTQEILKQRQAGEVEETDFRRLKCLK